MSANLIEFTCNAGNSYTKSECKNLHVFAKLSSKLVVDLISNIRVLEERVHAEHGVVPCRINLSIFSLTYICL